MLGLKNSHFKDNKKVRLGSKKAGFLRTKTVLLGIFRGGGQGSAGAGSALLGLCLHQSLVCAAAAAAAAVLCCRLSLRLTALLQGLDGPLHDVIFPVKRIYRE